MGVVIDRFTNARVENFGAVYRIQCTASKEYLAFKCSKSLVDKQQPHALDWEGEVYGKLFGHPCIVRIYDFFVDESISHFPIAAKKTGYLVGC